MISDLFRHEHPDTRTKAEWLKALKMKVPYKSNSKTGICLVCGNEFPKRMPNQVACTGHCSRLRKKQLCRQWQLEKYEKKEKLIKKCVICENEFKTFNPRALTCSPLCSDAHKSNKTKLWRKNEILTRSNSMEGHNH